MKLQILALFVLAFFSVSFAVTNVNSCQDLNMSGETYIINESFTATANNCLSVNNYSITIDGNGSTMTSGSYSVAIHDAGTYGYTLKNLTLSNYSSGIDFANVSTISYVTMRDVTVTVGITFYTSSSSVVMSNVSLINLTSTCTDCKFQLSSDLNPSNSNISNISYINLTYNGGFGINTFGLFTGLSNTFVFTDNLAATNLNISNVLFNNITFIGSGNPSINSLGIFAFSAGFDAGGTPATLSLKNSYISNISYINVSVTNGGVTFTKSDGVVSFAYTAGGNNNLLTNVTNTTFSNINTSVALVYCGISAGSHSVYVTNSSILGNPNKITGSEGLTGCTPIFSNFTQNLSYSSGVSTYSIVNGTGSYSVFDIPTTPSDTDGTINVSSYLNYSISGGSFSYAKMYYAPPANFESTITSWRYTSLWSQLLGGILNTTEKFFDLNTSAMPSSGTLGLFLSTPKINVILNSPANATTTINTSITFNWTCTDDQTFYPSYSANLTIDGIVNQTTIVQNGTPYNITISGFNSGTHLWNVSCTNSTSTNTSETRTLTILSPGIHFVSPTPTNQTNNFTYGIAFNFTSDINMTGNGYIDIDGTNKTCTLSSDNLSCSYALTYAEHLFNNSYDLKAWGNFSGTYITNSTPYNFSYYGCGNINQNATILQSINRSGNICLNITANNSIINGNNTYLPDPTTIFGNNNTISNLNLSILNISNSNNNLINQSNLRFNITSINSNYSLFISTAEQYSFLSNGTWTLNKTSYPTNYYGYINLISADTQNILINYSGTNFSSNPAIEDKLDLYNYSGGSWIKQNATLNMTTQTINYTNLQSGTYGLLSYPTDCFNKTGSSYSGGTIINIGDSNFIGLQTDTANNTCTHSAINTYYTGSGTNINVSNQTTNTTSFTFTTPITITSQNLLTLPKFSGTSNTIYRIAEGFGPNISSAQMLLPLPIGYSNLYVYTCSETSCSTDTGNWNGIALVLNAGNILATGDMDDLAFVVSYTPSGTGGGGSTGNNPTTTTEQPPPVQQQPITPTQQTVPVTTPEVIAPPASEVTTTSQAVSVVYSQIIAGGAGGSNIAYFAPIIQAALAPNVQRISPTIAKRDGVTVILSEYQGIQGLYLNLPLFNRINMGYATILFFGLTGLFMFGSKQHSLLSMSTLIIVIVMFIISVITVVLNQALLFFAFRALGG